jgi:hypothetical protein
VREPLDDERVTWVQVDATRCLAVPRASSVEQQLRELERVAHALEALAQHGSTSAEESLAGVRLAEVAALRARGIEVRTLADFEARSG